MKIKIYAIGKIKEQYLKLGIDEYKKRISAVFEGQKKVCR